MNYQDEYDAAFGDGDDEEVEAVAQVAPRARAKQSGTPANVERTYEEPEPQKELNNQFPVFYVSAFHKDTRERIVEQHQSIGHAANRANYLRFQQGYYTWVYGGVELKWQDKETGYQVK